MKKVESFTGVDGVQRQWSDIETIYYNDLITGRTDYVSPRQRLKNLLPALIQPSEKIIVRYFIRYFKFIITTKSIDLKNVIDRFDSKGFSILIYDPINKELTAFGKKLEIAFRYKYMRLSRLVKLASYMNIKTCLYCNSQFTLVVKKKKAQLANFQFDHFFPKSIYPYLSISLYNLIPACASCNLHKSAHNYSMAQFVHPYHENFHLLTSFTLNTQEQVRMLFGDVVREDEFNITLTNLWNNKVENYNEAFSLEGIYNRHKDIVIEIFRKAYAYRQGGKEALMALRDYDGTPVFASEDEIEWLLLANFTNVEDINKRPLAKFMQDIAIQAGLIR